MHGLNAILSNRSQLIVSRALYHADEPMTGRAVERACGLSNRATMLALDSLVEARAAHREPDGRAYLYTYNHDNYLASKALKPAFRAEDMFWEDLKKTVRRTVRPRPLAAVATGPIAREESEYGGRITLVMLFDTGRKRLKSLASIDALAETISDRYALVMEHQLLDMNIMDRYKYDALWRRVEREGILLFGELP